jgi:hypothetical protein
MKIILILVVIALVTGILLAVLASIKHPLTANPILFDIIVEWPSSPNS